ncbi:MAG TPA: diguanylate cyclase, partial [Steroidobacteraceae bacterium]|nr:diguanylate cyclase [Steroidobacteraceae bacterium]
PDDEGERLSALNRLGLLDTPPDESFDRVTRLVARTLDVPIALVTLVDEHRQWFKSRVGFPATETSREISFAAHSVYARLPLVVQNAALDPRFADNPLVTGPPYARAYLGIPIYTTNKQPIGTLCAMDTRPRDFGPDETALLSDFAKIAQDTIHAQELAIEGQRILQFSRDSEHKHREIERRLHAITNSIPAMIGYWNTELRCEFANDAYRQLLGLTAELGMHLKEVLGDKLFELNWPHAKAALAGEPQRFQRRVIKPDGTPAHTEGQYLPDRDDAGNVRGFYVLVTDVSELTAAKGDLEISNAKLLKESTTDFLTSLANRRVFSDRSEAASVAFRESGAAYGLILLDLDNFKLINDQHGHDIGDDVLRAVGKILAEQLRGREDLAARLGGEEFAVLCFGDFTEDLLFELAARIRAQIHKTTVNTPKGGAVSFTGSFGIACSNPDDVSWKTIFARADVALYEAKATGKDRINFGRTVAKGASGKFKSIRLVPGP